MLNKIKILALTACMMAVTVMTGCTGSLAIESAKGPGIAAAKSSGQIYLYGETHGVANILKKELELWGEKYNKDGMRHLFVELPYYTAEYLNLWMKDDTNEILDAVYDEWNGTASHVPAVKEFYETIKKQYPETILHGTDVGHQYNTTGERYLKYLQEHDLGISEQYTLAQDNMEQGKYFYDNSDDVYRENKMVENFKREFNRLKSEPVMGIYGGAHTGLDATDQTGTVPCMANQLQETYGAAVHSEDLTWIAKDIAPSRVDTIRVGGKDYKASYFGKEDLTNIIQDFASREFWRLEDSYDDFKDKPKSGDALPYNNFPMLIETKQVFVLEYVKKDGTVLRMYYRSDGNTWNGSLTTEEFKPE